MKAGFTVLPNITPLVTKVEVYSKPDNKRQDRETLDTTRSKTGPEISDSFFCFSTIFSIFSKFHYHVFYDIQLRNEKSLNLNTIRTKFFQNSELTSRIFSTLHNDQGI